MEGIALLRASQPQTTLLATASATADENGGSVADRPQPKIRYFPHSLCILRAVSHVAGGATADENGGSVADRPQPKIRYFPHSLCILRAVSHVAGGATADENGG